MTVELRFGVKPGARMRVHLTETEAKGLRDHLMALFPLSEARIQISDNGAAAAALAVDQARKEGNQ